MKDGCSVGCCSQAALQRRRLNLWNYPTTTFTTTKVAGIQTITMIWPIVATYCVDTLMLSTSQHFLQYTQVNITSTCMQDLYFKCNNVFTMQRQPFQMSWI